MTGCFCLDNGAVHQQKIRRAYVGEVFGKGSCLTCTSGIKGIDNVPALTAIAGIMVPVADPERLPGSLGIGRQSSEGAAESVTERVVAMYQSVSREVA